METLSGPRLNLRGKSGKMGTRGRHPQAVPHPERGNPGPGPLARGPCVNGD